MNALSVHVLNWLLATTVQVALLVGLLLVAECLFRRLLSPGWRHALWVLALVPLVCPVLPSSPWSPLNLLPISKAGRTEPAPRPAGLEASITVTGEERTAAPLPPSPAYRAAAAVERAATVPVLPSAVVGLWAVCALAMAVRHWRVAHAFRRRIGQGREADDPGLLAELAECRESMGLRRRVRMVETDAVVSPALAGIWRPTILLPAGLLATLSREERHCLFLHELAHVKRWDLALDALAGLCQLVYWFNPAAHFVAARLRATREVACDAHVLGARSVPDRAQLYARTLLKLATHGSAFRAMPALAGMAERTSCLETRLRSIRQLGPAKRRRHIWGSAIAALVAVIGLCRAGGPGLPDVEEPGAPATEATPWQLPVAVLGDRPKAAQGGPEVTTEILYIEIRGDTPEAVEATLAKFLPKTVRPENTPAEDTTRAGILSAAETRSLRFAATASGGTILSAPKITAVSGENAVIRMVEERYLPTGWSQFDEKGKLNVTPDGEPFAKPVFAGPVDIGCVTELVSRLQPDRTTVNVEVFARAVDEPEWERETVKDVRDPTREFVAQMPKIITRAAKATLDVPADHTACLVANTVVCSEKVVKRTPFLTVVCSEKVVKRTPFLGSLPGIGKVFRKEETKLVAKGLVVLVTPTVRRPDGPGKAE